MTPMFAHYEWWLLFLPLLGVVVNTALGKRLGRRGVGMVACTAVGLAFLVAVSIFVGLLQLSPEERLTHDTLYQWLTVGGFRVAATIRIDPLSVLMALVVTGVGFLIHVYSIGYMHEDESYVRYFALLNLFVFSMLLLVLSDNFLLLYAGWELVGLCSYALIGFWYRKPAAAAAGKKAFIVTRIGDVGFALGILFIFARFGTLDYQVVFDRAPQFLDSGQATVIALLLFCGAVGKSAQLPLHIWLPDAMEGPTPVSALIHAATMVTAGVYMVARTHAIFALSPTAMAVVATIGALTALFAASIALTQTDLKRILAYSTISQLGYMFVGVGVGAYVAGMFHLTTHAFFKALLFLGAGSVMHATAGVIDITRLGGLRERMPTTYRTFLVGAATLAGFPLLSGFFSKDEILLHAFLYSPLLWGVGLFTALLTAVYSFRAVFVPFWGQLRDTGLHPHESPPVMTVPLVVLAVAAVVGGLIGLPHLSAVEGFLEPVFADVHHAGEPASAGGFEWVLMAVSALVALAGISLAYGLYVAQPEVPAHLRERLPLVHRVLVNKYYVDEFYGLVVVRPLKAVAHFCHRARDR